MRSSQRRILWLLVALVIVLLIAGLVSAAVYWWMGRQPAFDPGWQDPIAEVDVDRIEPGLALYPLAGASLLETADASIDDGQLETAYATLAWGWEAMDTQRLGRLIRLGQELVQAKEDARAHRVYQQVADMAVLSPELNDPTRADALMSAGQGWAALDQEDLAQWAYDQVYTLAVHSPYLQVAHRREWLQKLVTAYRDLGAAASADRCRQRIVELDQGARPQPTAPALESPPLPGMDEPVSSPEVGALEESRRQAAYALLQSLSGGGEAPSGLVTALADALRAEDSAKMALYGQVLNEARIELGQRINVHWHLIRWLRIKDQVARKGYGLSLVPEWEAQATEIQSQLTTTYEDLFFDYEDWVASLPNSTWIEPARYRERRLITLAGRMGWYPNYPEQQMADKIRDAATALIAAGLVDPLYVDVALEEKGLRFTLSPGREYGTPSQGP